MKQQRKADRRREAHLIYQGAITEAGSVEEIEILRQDIRGDHRELGMRRRTTLEGNCDRRANQLGQQGLLRAAA